MNNNTAVHILRNELLKRELNDLKNYLQENNPSALSKWKSEWNKKI